MSSGSMQAASRVTKEAIGWCRRSGAIERPIDGAPQSEVGSTTEAPVGRR